MPTVTPQYATLTPNSVTTFDFSDQVGNYLSRQVKVTVGDGASAPVYFRTDGTAPTVGGAGCDIVWAAGGWETATLAPPIDPSTGARSGQAVVKLISAAAAGVKVEVL